MPFSITRVLTSQILALTLLVGGLLHGMMSAAMADPMGEPAMTLMDGQDACHGCTAPADALSGADCAVVCVNQVGVIAGATLPEGLEPGSGTLHAPAAISGVTSPPDPSPPKHRLG